MHSPSILLFFFITIIIFFIYSLKCEARDSINVRNPLNGSGDTLVSAGKRFQLGFFTPEGNNQKNNNRYVGIWYYNSSPRTVVWVANRDKPLSDSCGVFGLDVDGNLKVWCSNNGTVFPITSLEKSSTFNRTLQLLDSGNLILFDGTNRDVWQSFEVPTDTFLPGMKMKDNIKLTSWIGPSDPGTGNFTFQADQGVYTIQNRSTVHWKSGEPGTLSMYNNDLPYVVAQMLSDSDKGLDQKRNGSSNRFIPFPNYTRVWDYNNSRLLMNSSGHIQYYYFSRGNWSLLWSEPENRCSVYDACGKFATCNVKNERICQCLPGFRPASDGCERESSKICNAHQSTDQKDVFLNVSLMNVVGRATQFNRAEKEADCKAECLSNCKCEAYSYTGVNTGDRETGNAAAKCWIWTSDLANLRQGYADVRLRLSVRVPSSAIGDSFVFH
ncbi:hypothetical protein DH2020_022838 [Rehmannia glutinosa]|uniref:non-specific serine/threonine protein kinase n=1 Tax=Rehmannia glutinosa TaxID=99300 RepID=A0ABR0W5S3_REHGL